MRPVAPLLALLWGCGGPPLPDQIIEGRWVRYHYWADVGPPCEGVLEGFDRFIDQLGVRFGKPVPDGFKVDYYRMRERVIDDQRLCGHRRLGGCAVGTTVYIGDDDNGHHELTHAFLNRFGRPPSLFTEGIAVMFGCGPLRDIGNPLLPAVDPAALVEESGWNSGAASYDVAGAFVRFLVDRHGLEAFMRFYSTPWNASRAEIDAHFRDAFGAELADTLAEWQSRPPPRAGEWCEIFDDACDALSDVVVPGSAARLDVPVNCQGSGRALEVTTAAWSRIRFTADQLGRSLSVLRCAPTGTSTQAFSFAALNAGSSGAMDGKWIERWAWLEPGRYTLGVKRTLADFSQLDSLSAPGGTATVAVSSEQAPFGDSCAAPALAIADDTYVVGFRATQAALADAGVLRLAPAHDRQLSAVFSQGLGRSPQLCSSCSAGCTDLRQSPSGTFVTGTSTVRIQPESSGGTVFFEMMFEPP